MILGSYDKVGLLPSKRLHSFENPCENPLKINEKCFFILC